LQLVSATRVGAGVAARRREALTSSLTNASGFDDTQRARGFGVGRDSL